MEKVIEDTTFSHNENALKNYVIFDTYTTWESI